MKRYFIRYQNQLESPIILDSLTLDSENLKRKVPQSGSSFSLNKVVHESSINNTDLEKYLNYLNTVGEELLIEIPSKEKHLVPAEDLLEFERLANGNYFNPVTFEPNVIRLLNVEAPVKTGKLMLVKPTNEGSGNLSIVISGHHPDAGKDKSLTRSKLNTLGLGSDLYLLSDEEIDEYQLWGITEFSEIKPGVYQMTKNDFILFEEEALLKEDEKRELSSSSKKFLSNIFDNPVVYLGEDPLKIYLFDDVTEDIRYQVKPYRIVRRESLIPYLNQGFSNIPFKEHLRVVTQNGSGFINRSLEDILNPTEEVKLEPEEEVVLARIPVNISK